jgi:hypothetical protein
LALVPLAAAANGHVFDVDEPSHEAVAEFWADVDRARRRLRSGQSFWQRLRADVSLRTFRDHLPTGSGLAPAARRTSRSGSTTPRRGRSSSKAGIGTAAPGTRAARRGPSGRSGRAADSGRPGRGERATRRAPGPTKNESTKNETTKGDA